MTEHETLPERDLPPGRHAQYRELLMRHITAETAAHSGPAAPAAGPRTAPRFRTVLVAAATAAALVGGAVVYGAAADRAAVHGPQADGTRPVQYVAVEPGNAQAAAFTLQRIAAAASAAPQLTVRPGQWAYVRFLSEFTEPTADRTFDSPWRMGPMKTREDWRTQDPGKGVDMYRENGGPDVEIDDSTITTPIPPGGDIGHPTYAWASRLPTDPAALLQEIYRETAGNGSTASAGKEETAFETIGELLWFNVLPPQATAALYRATALIPGVELVPDAVDAAGRHGLGIARVESGGERHEWIFDKSTYAFLGERDYLVRTTVNGKAGMLIGLTAILGRAIVDHRGDVPSGGTATTAS
ncbi:CU044_5270 family protein [Streptacidiphilus rugosus]|uniref:CU044_5270 family protein n=1 Tax=Streptacidiphilus rugosus TaxID=405783 RepID=UPI000565A221|nr:CU044_5270 family protein [Streptacidiphilus rugosus]